MSTPTGQSTAAKHPTPSTASAHAATPRSVPSPAATRPHAGSTTSRPKNAFGPSLGGVPMAPSLSQASIGSGRSFTKHEGVSSNFSHGLNHTSGGSSGMGALNFVSPNTMAGLDNIGTPNGLGLGMEGGVGMGISLSDIGISSLGTQKKRDDDEDRRRKLVNVLSALRGKRQDSHLTGKRMRVTDGLSDSADGELSSPAMGRISDEGVRRVARWAGFDVDVDKKFADHKWEGNRAIAIAGSSAVLIDLAFEAHAISKVEVTFGSENEAVVEQQAGAAQILRDNLTVPHDGSATSSRLDLFAANLKVLARFDKLSSEKVNCVEAMVGLYSSLKLLYDYELQAALKSPADTATSAVTTAELDVRDKQSGRPIMHASQRVGLSIEYAAPHSDASGYEATFNLDLTVAPNDPPTTFQSLRISSSWLSEQVKKETGPSLTIIDWLEPDPTLIASANADPNSMSLDGELAGPQLPQVRFVAKLRPPIVLPYNIAWQVLQSVGVAAAPVVEQALSYEALLLGISPHGTIDGPIATAAKMVFATSTDRAKDVSHQYNLYVPKQEYGFKLEELPFAHPRDIISILPILRQWVAFGEAVRSVLYMSTQRRDATTSVPTGPGVSTHKGVVKTPQYTTSDRSKKIALSGLVGDHGTGPGSRGAPGHPETGPRLVDNNDALRLDLTLATAPLPSLTIFVPLADRLASVSFSVLTNAEMVVTSQDLAKSGSGQPSDTNGSNDMDVDTIIDEAAANQKVRDRLGKALTIVHGDLGVWVEWIRREYA